jgi:Protein of unknown function (DUF1573)
MKATLFALVALAAGVAVGMATTKREFSNEILPVDIPVTVNGQLVAPKAKIGPKVTIVNGERHDFGTMDRNAHGTHAWIVRNDGDAPLTLSTGQPSCGVCIKVFSVVKETLAPGEKTEVKIEWDVKTSDAEFEQSGPLNTNDKNKPAVHLSLKGHVLDTIRSDRSDVHFHDLSANESASGGVNIYAFREADLQVEKHEFNNPSFAKHVKVSFAPLTSEEVAREPKAKGGVRMSFELQPGLPFGDFNESVSVTTNQNPEPLTVRVIGNIATDVLLMGPNVTREKMLVSLGAITQKAGKQHTIFILVKGPHRDDTKVAIESVEPASEFSAKLGEPIRDSAKIVRYPITIEVPAGATPVTRLDGSYAKINVTTTHPDVKEMNIKVRYVVKE